MIASILKVLESCPQSPESERSLIQLGSSFEAQNSDISADLLHALAEYCEKNAAQDWPRYLMLLLGSGNAKQLRSWLTPQCESPICQIYSQCPSEHVLRNQLLAMLIYSGCVDAWLERVCNDPPATIEGIELAFVPLSEDNSILLSPEQLQQLIEQGTDNRSVAASIYELANREFREGRIAAHPVANRIDPICELTGHLIQRLALIEEGKLPDGATPETVAQIVQESVALIIALIDTLALLNHEPAKIKLKQALELKHRRLQVEAAAGLARLSDEEGANKLIELAEHPVVRPRVIAYAKELGIADQISLELKGNISTAESVLALWLSHPEQMGLAPTSMKLIEQRELYWPSYEDPVECFLFEFVYGTGENAFRNIGISGPLTHAFVPDISHLNRADQFSAFAGWQTLTDEIFLVSVEKAEQVLAGDLNRLQQQLKQQAIENPTPIMMASFFGEYVLIVDGAQDQENGTLIVGRDETAWIGQGNKDSPIDWQLAFDIWKGRKLLTNFNPAFS